MKQRLWRFADLLLYVGACLLLGFVLGRVIATVGW